MSQFLHLNREKATPQGAQTVSLLWVNNVLPGYGGWEALLKFFFFFFFSTLPNTPTLTKGPTHTHKSRATSESIISQMCGFAAQKRSCFTCRQRTHLAAGMNFRPTFFLKKKVKTKKQIARAEGRRVAQSDARTTHKGGLCNPLRLRRYITAWAKRLTTVTSQSFTWGGGGTNTHSQSEMTKGDGWVSKPGVATVNQNSLELTQYNILAVDTWCFFNFATFYIVDAN